MNETVGIVLLNKPAGITSFNAISKIKRKINKAKIGHTGTLDKFAEGLLVLVVGCFTKLTPYFTGLTKRYTGTVCFGKQTETLDPEGEIVETGEIPSLNKINEIIPSFRGEIDQIPPKFSAIHINGKRSYKRVLDGEDFEIPSRKINIYDLHVLKYNKPELEIDVKCSKGTYIRSLARDIAKKAGSCGYLNNLVRTEVGSMNLSSAVSIEDFDVNKHIIKPKEAIDFIDSISKIQVDKDIEKLVLNGLQLEPKRFGILEDNHGLFAVFSETWDFLALVENSNNRVNYQFVAPKDNGN